MTSARLTPLARASVALASVLCIGNAAAFTAETTELSATSSIQIDGSDPFTANDTRTTAPITGGVDVMESLGSYRSFGSVHSFGTAGGDFGSRASGRGLFDVVGTFSIQQTVTNDALDAQFAAFNFHITPGLISTSSPFYTAREGQFLESGMSFNVTVNGHSVWNSSYEIRTTVAGTETLTSGDQSIYSVVSTGAFPQVGVGGGNALSAMLGRFNAGESVTLRYEMQTWARGNSGSDPEPTVPTDLPVTFSLMAVAADSAVGCVPDGVAEFDLCAGYAGATSGDPFGISGGNVFYDPFSDREPSLRPFSVTAVTAPVPEPETYAMMLAGLGIVGWMGRRRRVR